MSGPVGQAVFIEGGNAASIKDTPTVQLASIIINPPRKPTIYDLKKTYDDGHATPLNDYDKLIHKIENLNPNDNQKQPLLWRMYYGLDYFVDYLEEQWNLNTALDRFLNPEHGTNSTGPG